MKKAIFIVLIILIQLPVVAQQQPVRVKLDSIRALTRQMDLPDSVRINAFFNLASLYRRFRDLDSALYYTYAGRKEAETAGYKWGIMASYHMEGMILSAKRNYNEALKCYFKDLELAMEMNRVKDIVAAYTSLGGACIHLNMLEKSIEYLTLALEEARKYELQSAVYMIMSNLASTYSQSGNYQKSASLNQELITLLEGSKIENRMAYAAATHNLGSAQKKMGDYVSAVKNFQKAAIFNKEINNEFRFLEINLSELGSVLLKDTLNKLGAEIGDTRPSVDIAISYLEQLEQLATAKKDTGSLVNCYLYLSQAWLAKGDRVKALDIGRKGWSWCKRFSEKATYEEYLDAMGKIYFASGNYRESAIFYRDRIRFTDSLEKVETAEKVALLSTSYEIEQRDEQLKAKEHQLEKNRIITWLFVAISAFIFILAGIVFYFLRQKQKATRLLEKQNREIEQARARAEQSEKFKEQFLARMSHEIRTPLNAVIGMTGLLLDESQPPKTENYLKSIKQAGEHLTGIINEILDLSKIDAGKLELHEIPFNMQNLLKEIENLFETRAKEKELQLIIEKADGSPDWFLGDSNRIRQVLVNLVGNAVKFTDQGSVQVKMTVDDIREDKAMITFSVEDTGPGIPKEAQTKIFEEFVQAEQAGDHKVAGTGLGLSIVRKLVNRMGGTLALESEPGKGSAFSFTVPLALSSEEAWKALQKEKDLSLMAIKGAYRILVVEDNPSNQIVTEGMLEKILPEATTIIAESGLKALDLLEKEKFDLVLMDIRMPGIDGYETTRRLRLMKNDNAIVPVIALTASVIRVDIQRCLDAGMNGYVPKPVPRGALAKAIREQLKITGDENYISEEAKEANFLDRIKDRPAWSDRLFELCNGKKERFMKYLDIFITQAESETGSWQTLTEQQQHEPLAFSVHKLLPYIRIFMDEKTVARAIALDQELRKGWMVSHTEAILSLKQGIMQLGKEAQTFAQSIQ